MIQRIVRATKLNAAIVVRLAMSDSAFRSA